MEHNHSIIELEALAMIYIIKKITITSQDKSTNFLSIIICYSV